MYESVDLNMCTAWDTRAMNNIFAP